MKVDTSSRNRDPEKQISQVLDGLTSAVNRYTRVVLASSMSAEDMLLVDVVARNDLSIGVFVLDTARLHSETYALIQETRDYYGISIKMYTPEHDTLEEFVTTHRPNGFYNSVEARKSCCAIRKVAPLRRALAGSNAWVTGMRRDQSITRAGIAQEEWDATHGLHKINPLVKISDFVSI